MMNNAKVENEMVNVEEMRKIAQDATMDVELMFLEAASSIDETMQKQLFKSYCNVAGDTVGIIAEYPENMKIFHKSVVSVINDLLGTGEEKFYDTMELAEHYLINLECMDEYDLKTLSVIFPYIRNIYKVKGLDSAKNMLKTIKLYLTVVFDFIKSRIR